MTINLPTEAPNVHVWPAMGVGARYYARFPDQMAAYGWRAHVHQWRGTGDDATPPSRRHDWGYRELVEEDMARAAARTRDEYPDAPQWVFGHSLGGQLGMLLAASRPDLIDRVVTVAACSVYWRAFPERARRVWVFTQAASGLASALGSFPGSKVGFAGHEARGVMRDWAHQARTGRYEPAGSCVDYEARLAESEVPALNLSIAGDDQMAPAGAVDHLAQKVPNHTRRHIADPRWPEKKRHFVWVKQPERVFDAVASWTQ